LWSFPGGRLRHGERLLEGVARELNEETGIKLSDMMLGSEYEIVEYIESDWHFVILAATGFAGHGVLPIPGDDAKRACWVSVRDLMDPSFRCTAQCSDTVKQTWSRLVRFVASEGSVTSV
jgi:ADP-ribose pyrophosphatase YjhB (NUDIX family)